MKVTFNPFTNNFDFTGSGGDGTPASPDTSVQFNDNGAFGGDANFVYNKDTGELSVINIKGFSGQGLSIYTPDEATPAGVNFIAGGATSGDADGGGYSFQSGFGSGTGAGGPLAFTGAVGGETGNGSPITLTAGNGGATSGSGGPISITAGNTSVADNMTAGSSGQVVSTAGQVTIVSTGDIAPGANLNLQGASIENDGGFILHTGNATLSGGDINVADETLYFAVQAGGVGVQGGTVIGSTGNATQGSLFAYGGGWEDGEWTGGRVDIFGGQVSGVGPGGGLNLGAGNGGSTSGSAGSIFLTAGSAQGGDSNGGNIFLTSGNGSGANNGADINVVSGNSGATGIRGGEVNLQGGQSETGLGGNVNLVGGFGSLISGTGNGGDVYLAGGGSGGGTPGKIMLSQTFGSTKAILDTSLLAASDKTFAFPNASGTFAVSASGNIALSAAGDITFTGTLPIANGGTGATTLADAGIVQTSGHARATAQTAANTNVLTYTVGAADGTFQLLANVLVTTSTAHSFGVTVDYTDESNVSRTLTIPVAQLVGTLITAITNVTGAGPYEGVALTIRAKAATNIVFKTAGTFTTVTYNVDASIIQVA